jgi:hypothetical protein
VKSKETGFLGIYQEGIAKRMVCLYWTRYSQKESYFLSCSGTPLVAQVFGSRVIGVETCFRIKMSFHPLFHESLKVGRRIKSSKKKYTWRFQLDSQEFTIDLFVSKISSKRKILLNGDIKFSGKKANGILFSYAFKIGPTTVMVF